MIAFGFGIYKVLQVLQAQSKVPGQEPHAARNVGLALIGIGTFVVITASLQHWKALKRPRSDQPCKPWDLALIVACLLALLGLLMFGSVILNAGPLG
jgi:uncharacterized membrane protein YidH (DUF202 family)